MYARGHLGRVAWARAATLCRMFIVVALRHHASERFICYLL